MTDKETWDKLTVPIPVEEKPGKKDKNGNLTVEKYVPIKKVVERLNDVWGLDWNLTIPQFIFQDGEVAVVIGIEYPTENGRRTKQAIGGKKYYSNMDLGNLGKASASIALVKAASYLGIVGDYDEDEPASEEELAELISLFKQAKMKPPYEELKKLSSADVKNYIIVMKEKLEQK